MTNIDNYMTPNEASYRWGINQETVKNKLKPSLNKKEIEQMEKDGLIRFVREEDKRKIYIITDLGKEVLNLEMKRIERLYKNMTEVR